MFVGCARDVPTPTERAAVVAPSTSATAPMTSPLSGDVDVASTGAGARTGTGQGERERPVRIEAPADAEVASFIRAARARAVKDGRVVLVEVGAAWCKPCRTLKAAIDRGELDGVLAKVTLIAFDVDAHGPRLDSLGYRSKFVPYFAVPNGDGSASERRLDVKLASNATAKELGAALGPMVEAARAP